MARSSLDLVATYYLAHRSRGNGADRGEQSANRHVTQSCVAVIALQRVYDAAGLFSRLLDVPGGDLILLKGFGRLIECNRQLPTEGLKVCRGIYLLSRWRIEEAAFAFDGELPINNAADGYCTLSREEILVLRQHYIAIPPKQRAYLEEVELLLATDENMAQVESLVAGIE